ncbi:hypothetical protein EYF80_007191 [Liparis tanakae]|uniref:Uncharacterized protein n=1 Tax=Liparis tanakae TaxID=230148 RepID=A0A4Z2IZR8_9TELE|nr:hypothetical protein EYF80_007191 [Liparis tanakae]
MTYLLQHVFGKVFLLVHGMIQGVRPAGEEFLQWVGVREEEGVPPEEAVGEVEEASCPQGAAGEAGTYLQKMVWVEEAEGRRGGRGEGLQEQQLPTICWTIRSNSSQYCTVFPLLLSEDGGRKSFHDLFVPAGHETHGAHDLQHRHLGLDVLRGQALGDDVDALGVREDVGAALRVVHQSLDAADQRRVDLRFCGLVVHALQEV